MSHCSFGPDYCSFNHFKSKFKIVDSDYARLIAMAEKRNIKGSDEEIQHAKKGIVRNLRALIARAEWQGNGYFPIINEDDKAMLEAVKLLSKSR